MILGNIGMPVGTEVVVPTAGALAATGHFGSPLPIPAWIQVAAVATLAEVIGGTILYAVGYYGGVPFVKRYGKYVMFREHELDRVHSFYERYGKLTVFWCRFVPFVRGVAAFPAGISRMPKRFFLAYTALGSAIFCFILAYVGNEAGRNVGSIVSTVHESAKVIIVVVLLLVIGGVVAWRIRARQAAAKAIAVSPLRPPR
jgi:membrane protein DedA with SNARE-associated domain